MEYSSEEIEVTSKILNNKSCVVFKFKGYFSIDTCIDFCEVWEREFKDAPADKKFTLIWDCSEMTGFDISAKNHWTKSMNTHEPQISSVTVISNNMLIRGAARLVLQLFSFDVSVARSYNDIKLNIPALA